MDSSSNPIDILYRTYSKSLLHYLTRLTGSAQLAEDMLHETFVKAIISIKTIDYEQAAHLWLFTVARHTYLDEWRKQQRRKNNPIYQFFLKEKEMFSPYGIPEEQLLVEQQALQLEQLLMLLPEHYRTILLLREYEHLTYEEIAVVTSYSVDQVKVTLYRARKKLAKHGQQWEDDK